MASIPRLSSACGRLAIMGTGVMLTGVQSLQDVISALDRAASAETGEKKSHGALQLCIGRNVVCAELIVGAGRSLGDPLLGGEASLAGGAACRGWLRSIHTRESR